MPLLAASKGVRETAATKYYRRAVEVLRAADIPFLVAGAFALRFYTGIDRDTKDFDIFLRRCDVDAAQAALARVGYATDLTYPHWLAKAHSGKHFIDMIFNMANGMTPIDESWFTPVVTSELFGYQIQVVGPEDMIFSKLFTQDRRRYDGADVAHLLRALVDRLSWRRLLDRAGMHWPALFSQLVLFGYIYPGEQARIPRWVLQELSGRLLRPGPDAAGDARVCRGTAFSPTEYGVDVHHWGYQDVRLPPWGTMTPEEVHCWTEGVLAGK